MKMNKKGASQNTIWIVSIVLILVAVLVVFKVDLNLNSRFAVGVGNLDQSFTNGIGFYQLGTGMEPQGQTFTPTQSKLDKIELQIYSSSPGSTLTLAIYDSPSKTATLLSPSAYAVTNTGWYEFPMFGYNIVLTPGHQYYLELKTYTGTVAINAGSGTYSGGNRYMGGFSLGAGQNINFKTYYTTPTCNTEADTDCNGVVSNSELVNYGNLWIGGSKTRAQLATVIVAWVGGS